MKTNIQSFFAGIFLIIGLTVPAIAQQITVKGNVTEALTNKVLKGVSVQIKGTKTKTTTNATGDYTLLSEKGKTLIFSLSGYESSEVIIKNTLHNVSLKMVKLKLEDSKKFTAPEIRSSQDMIENDSYQIQTENVSKSLFRMECKDVERKVKNKQTISYVSPSPYDQAGTEEYETHAENCFLSAKNDPLSTFSLDVDAASYSNVRRIINQGQLPSKEAVRVEELINYFSYDYKQPKGDHPVNIVTETAVCPWNPQHGIIRIGVKAKEIPSENLPASNFVFLIDVSGSMEGPTRLGLVKSSLKLLINNLREKDRVSIVVYAGAAGVVLPSTEGSDKQMILEAIENLRAGGSTAGGAGIQLAYQIAEKNLIAKGNNRVILCTDGDFNVGVSSTSELEQLIESKRKTGIFLTVLGYGMGNYKDNRLQTLAQKGNGNHAYIDNIQEANKVLVNEFGSTMYTVAKDVKIQVEFNPAYISSYRLVGYESRLLNKEDFNDDTKDAGELGSGHTVTALYEIIPVGVENKYGGVDKLKYQQEEEIQPKTTQSNAYPYEFLTVKLRYKNPTEDISKKMEIPILATQLTKTPSNDFKFAMAAAMFGQLLRDSDYKGTGTYEQVISLAKEGLNEDTHGYRREFIRLVEAVNQLTK